MCFANYVYTHTHTRWGPSLGSLVPSLLSLVIKRRVVISRSSGAATVSPPSAFPFSVSRVRKMIALKRACDECSRSVPLCHEPESCLKNHCTATLASDASHLEEETSRRKLQRLPGKFGKQKKTQLITSGEILMAKMLRRPVGWGSNLPVCAPGATPCMLLMWNPRFYRASSFVLPGEPIAHRDCLKTPSIGAFQDGSLIYPSWNLTNPAEYKTSTVGDWRLRLSGTDTRRDFEQKKEEKEKLSLSLIDWQYILFWITFAS